MSTHRTERPGERVLVVSVPSPRSDAMFASLRQHGLIATAAPLGPDIGWPDAEFDAALVAVDQWTATLQSVPLVLKRARPDVPVVLSAPLLPSSIEEVLDAGIDAWLDVATPLTGVAAQIRALHRLRSPNRGKFEPESATVRGLTVHYARREALVNGHPIPLTPTEFRIVAHLARQPGRVVSHGELFHEVHGYDTAEQEAKDILKVHLSRLRGKLAHAGLGEEMIVTVRGFGYLLERRGPLGRDDEPVSESTDDSPSYAR